MPTVFRARGGSTHFFRNHQKPRIHCAAFPLVGEVMGETILGFLVVAAILIGSALLTHLFTRAMYNRCPSCGALNAKRRTRCRICSHPVG